MIDLTGRRFGKLVVIQRNGHLGQGGRKRPAWFCQCGCGNTKTIMGNKLTTKNGVTSCGCTSASTAGVNLKDLTGKQFTRLTVIKRVENRGEQPYWLCECSCGNMKEIAGGKLRDNAIKSCGCLQREVAPKQMTTHGMHKTRTYGSWSGMRNRCTNENSSDYPRYGGRGIIICDRWLNSFENFFEDMGERPRNTSIERIDNDKGYNPDNCKWGTVYEQNRNRRDTRLITHNGQTLLPVEWSKLLGGGKNMVGNRLKAGWSDVKAVTTPVSLIHRTNS